MEANQRCSSPTENANTYVKAPDNDELWRLETGETADQDGLRARARARESANAE